MKKRLHTKICFVPRCNNTSKNSTKLFLSVPHREEIRRKWCEAAQREKIPKPSSGGIYCCEDHFILESDMDNYWEHKLMKNVCLRLAKGVVPHLFECQIQNPASEQRKPMHIPVPSPKRIPLKSVNESRPGPSRYPEGAEAVEETGFSMIDLPIKEEDIPIQNQDILEDPLAQDDANPSLTQEITILDPLSKDGANLNSQIEPTVKQEYDLETSETLFTSSATTGLNLSEPEIFIKEEQEDEVSHCTDPLEKTSPEKFHDDFLKLVRVVDCSKPAKPRKRRKQTLLPMKSKMVKLPKTNEMDLVNFGVGIKQLNGLNTNFSNFEVKAQPTDEEADGFSQKVFLEIKITPRNEPTENQVKGMTERVEQLLEKDIKKSERIGKLQKIISNQKKQIDQMTKIVNNFRVKIINAEHDYASPQ